MSDDGEAGVSRHPPDNLECIPPSASGDLRPVVIEVSGVINGWLVLFGGVEV